MMLDMKNENIYPFIKWAGGKRQLLNALTARMPKKFNNYYEPFLGGGAMLFHLQPDNAVINDLNGALINTYKVISMFPEDIMSILDEYYMNIQLHGRDFYFTIRDAYNTKILKMEYDIETAAMFIFINKHCFNGLYRVNRAGVFNVAYNNTVSHCYDRNNILTLSEYLKTVEIYNTDYATACLTATEGDFVFLDSPYAPLNSSSFSSYTNYGFDDNEHIRLSNFAYELSERGCYIILTNHDTELVRDLYKDFTVESVSVRRSINSDATKRSGKEVIIRNFSL